MPRAIGFACARRTKHTHRGRSCSYILRHISPRIMTIPRDAAVTGELRFNVYLAACAGPRGRSHPVKAWTEIAQTDVSGLYNITDDPKQADLILFVDLHLNRDWRLTSLRSHELVREFRDKVLVYDERDHPWIAIPGLFCSMPARDFDLERQIACGYYGLTRMNGQPDAEECSSPDLLFSFMGSCSHPCRREVLRLSHPRAHVEDTSGFVFYDCPDPKVYERQRNRYLLSMRRSKFILCPRGNGTGSFRLYETLASGRVPVIISDDWVPPAEVDWSALSLRVPESEIASIPSILEQAERCFPKMSAAAHATYRDRFAPEIIFHRFMQSCRELLSRRAPALGSRRGLRYWRLGAGFAEYRVRVAGGKILRACGLR